MTKEQKLAAAIRASGTELFNDNSYDHKRNAQNNLSGRTHYVDDGTLRYFHARIVAANPVTEGLIFWIIESSARDSRNTSRGFRFVAFDIFGTVIERADIDNMVNTKEQARRAFWEWFNGFDTLARMAKTRGAK